MRRPASRLRIGGLVALLLLLAATPVPAQEAAVGRVAALAGAATAERGDVAYDLAPGTPVRVGDRLVTGPGGRVKIAFADGSLLAVGPDSAVEISDYALDGAGGRVRGLLSLLTGILRATVPRQAPAAPFEVRTQAAVASVRSTDWTVEAGSDRTSVFVLKGRVAVAPAGGGAAVVLEQSFGTDVMPGEGLAAPKRWGAGRIRDALDRTRVP